MITTLGSLKKNLLPESLAVTWQQILRSIHKTEGCSEIVARRERLGYTPYHYLGGEG